MAPEPTCVVCEQPVDPADSHTFEDTSGRVIARHCRVHCPRCAPPEPAA